MMKSKIRDVAFLTGAGVSVDSGIPDFRTTSHNWKFEVPREEVFSRSFFKQNPQDFWNMFKETFVWDNKAPNNFHKLPEMLAASGRRVDVLTQNVDGFHGVNKEFMSGQELSDDGYTLVDTFFDLSVAFKYGSLSIFEAHGNASRVICLGCLERQPLKNVFDEDLPTCKKCEKVLKPDISLFGEGVSGFSDGMRAVINCDVLVVAGTSLNVGPVNELPLLYKNNNMKPHARSVWVNKEEPPSHYNFDKVFLGECSDFPDYFLNNFL